MSTFEAGYRTTRRGFLASAAGAAIGIAVMPAARLLGSPLVLPGSHVVKVTSRRVIEGLQVRTSRLQKIIDECVRRLAGRSNAADAWAKYALPGKRILLKFTRLPGEGLQTDGAMLIALLESLRGAGHDPGAITVADCQGAGRVDGLRPTPQGGSNRTVRLGGESEQVRR